MPYPYTLMPDGHTMEDEVKPPAETQEESTRPNSPFQDFGNPSSSPSSPSSSQLPAPPPGDNQPSQSPHEYADGPRSQSSEQASSSKSDEQGSKGSSQTEDSPDAGRATEETRAQAAPSDIDELEDEFDTYYGWIPGVSVDRQSAHSNLDVILVQQDIETRPLIFQHCFQHSASLQDAMEHIYAFPPDCDEGELRHLEQFALNGSETSAGMADGGISDNGSAGSGLEPDGFLLEYEGYLESVYRFQIEWADGSHDTNRLKQLQNLARSTMHIISYLDEVYKNDPNTTGIEAFRKHFSQNEYGKLVVFLGADDDSGAGDAGYGRVPLQPDYDEEGNLINRQELRRMYLGSKVNIPTIVHEFGHVVDRSNEIVSKFGIYHPDWYKNTGTGLNESILELAIEGFAGKQLLNAEVWGDLFMTAVLDPTVSGKTFKVYSATFDLLDGLVDRIEAELKEEGLPNARDEASRTFYDCGTHGGCSWRDVKWADKLPGYWHHFGALAQEHFPTLLRNMLS